MLTKPGALLAVAALWASGWTCSSAVAQSAGLARGFERVAPAAVVNEEIVRQPDFWMMEVQLKQMRMTWVELPDPKTGEKTRQEVWYLAWRALRRPVAGRPVGDFLPVNELDPLPGPPQFIPEFTLVTYDTPQSEIPDQILTDEILPGALPAIRRVEREAVWNTVAAVQELPEPVDFDVEDPNWIYGVATWRGIDPETDFFKVIISGFSNGYEIRNAGDGSQQVWQKVIVQRFARPGDRYDPDQREFLFVGQPEWTFQPEDPTPQSVGPAPTARRSASELR